MIRLLRPSLVVSRLATKQTTRLSLRQQLLPPQLLKPKVTIQAQFPSRRQLHTTKWRFNSHKSSSQQRTADSKHAHQSGPGSGSGSKSGTGSSGSKRQSLKELSKKYGWAAVGVYLTLSALDLPLCFLFVHSMGQERIAEWEKAIRGFFGYSTNPEDLKTAPNPADQVEDSKGGRNWNLILTELGIAYIIHKSVFIFVRIPATAAITPWAVKTLRKWGFNIGKSTPISGATGGSPANFGKPAKKSQRWWWFF